MRVCFLTLGTRGDVQPYLALAKHLISKGNTAVICTSESFRALIEKEGVEFKKATLDLMELANTDIGKKVLENPIKNFMLALKLSNEIMNPQYRKTFDDFYEAAKEADIIVYHPKALVAVDIGEKLGVPVINMPPVPIIEPISEFPCIAVGANKNWGSYLNKLSYKVNLFSDKNYIKLINDFRNQISLSSRKTGEYTYSFKGKKIPIIYPISSTIFKDVTSWRDNVLLSGFLLLDTQEKLSEELEQFITEGDKPIVVSFSSMPLKTPEKFMNMLKNALDKTNNRVVVLVGNSGIKVESSENIFITKAAPHSQLFPKAKAVIHHGGVGTTAMALMSSVPQMIIPFSVDQPFWAKRMFEFGVALRPVKESELSTEKLELLISELGNDELVQNAKLLGEKISKESSFETIEMKMCSILSNNEIDTK